MATNSSMVALSYPTFRWFWTAAAISNAASFTQMVAVPAVVYDQTHSGSWLGAVALAGGLPVFLLALFAGVLADRVPRRIVLIATQSVSMIVAFAFWYLAATGQLRPWNMFWLSLVNGIASGFQVPAWQSFVPSLVPREHLLAAVRLNSAQFTIARAVGPAFAGLVLRIWGVSTAFAANAVTFLLVIAVLLLVHPGQELAVGHNTVRDVLVDGARYVRARPPLLLAMGLAFVLSFCGQGLTQVSAGIAHDVFDQPTRASADLLTAFGFGTLSAGLVLVTLGTRVRTARLVAMSLLLYAAGIVALGATSRWPLGIAAFFVAGIGHVGSAVTLNAHVQSITEDVYRGRVVSFFLLGVVGGVPAGAVVLGRLGDRFGMRAVVIGDGLGFAVVVLLTMATGVFAVLNPISASTPATSPRTADQTGGPPSR